MFICGFVLVLCVFNVDAIVQNVSCPVVTPMELDWKELDGKWYLAAVATDKPVQGDCAMVLFSHKYDNSTDLSISWIDNNTVSFYNGSVNLSVDPYSNDTIDGDVLIVTYTDATVETYSFLTVDYEHYALMFTCTNNDDNSSNYEVWELTRSPHAKPKHVSKIFNALASYGLEDTVFMTFNNTDVTCNVNGGTGINLSSLIFYSVATLTVFRRLY
ncbi:uncharacterized protein LOC113240282 [Hyposmocoma kahamanoa]|uniref:uncharacterized protein LOC113240282 n=1 Tax=Hyposmocoma kahamanoa TaxID=1477025 RepID=UPI000E6D7D6A|nr:uncharacterized protein LOC113240282 [Hyposmocoma kahamanoa]